VLSVVFEPIIGMRRYSDIIHQVGRAPEPNGVNRPRCWVRGGRSGQLFVPITCRASLFTG
jgi:hypothetical protein